MIWLWLFVWPTRHTTWLVVSTASVNPPTPSTPPPIRSTHGITGCVQNVSQNQPVQPVAICVSVMIAIVLLYFWCKSYAEEVGHDV